MTMMSTLFEKRVEAAAREIWKADNTTLGIDPQESMEAWVEEAEGYLELARTVLTAADAVCCAHPKCPGGSLCCCQSDAMVTEEMIAETILKALVFTNENSKPWADGLARDIAALFRGGAK